MAINKINYKGTEYDLGYGEPIAHEISNLPQHSDGETVYTLRQTGNIVVLTVDNIWLNSIAADTWIELGTIPEAITPDKTLQGLVVGSRGDTGAAVSYGKVGVTSSGQVRCKMDTSVNQLSAVSFNLIWTIY